MLQNKSVICSGSRVTNSTVMKLHGSDNRGRIIVKTYKEHLLTYRERDYGFVFRCHWARFHMVQMLVVVVPQMIGLCGMWTPLH